MSNHAGSYMPNEVLHLLEERCVFRPRGPEAAQQLVLDRVKWSWNYDGNPGEILEEMGDRLEICLWCLSPGTDLLNGRCALCRQQKQTS